LVSNRLLHLSLRQSRLEKLLFTKNLGKPGADKQLTQQADPEPWPLQPLGAHQSEIRKDVREADTGRAGRLGQDHCRAAQDLTRAQRRGDVEPRQRLQENYAEAKALERVQYAQPQPQGAGEKGPDDGGLRIHGHVKGDAGGGPEHLAPAGCAEEDGEEGDEPAVGNGEAAEGEEEEGPDPKEEEEDEDEDSVGWGVLGAV
jgi:hypothetical protein